MTMRSPVDQGWAWYLELGMEAKKWEIPCAAFAVWALSWLIFFPSVGEMEPRVSERQQVPRRRKTMNMRGTLAMMAMGVMSPK